MEPGMRYYLEKTNHDIKTNKFSIKNKDTEIKVVCLRKKKHVLAKTALLQFRLTSSHHRLLVKHTLMRRSNSTRRFISICMLFSFERA